jgi:hypothetical protein
LEGTEVEVDRELVEAAQAGDRWALEELVRRTHRCGWSGIRTTPPT